MSSALIGYSGFVGSTLLKQRSFDERFRSVNIEQIAGQKFDLLVCAGAPAQKWLANRDPENDLRGIERLMGCLDRVECNTFILISTVDVFAQPHGVDEASVVDTSGLHAYGLHRLRLEKFVAERFARHLIVRLPGLVGPGLRKNAIYDLLHDNSVQEVDSRSVFQFYPMVNLWNDITTALNASLRIVHLTSEPISLSEIAKQAFSRNFEQHLDKPITVYDFRSKHANLFGGHGAYQYSRREELLAIRAYVQSEAVHVA